MKYFRRLTESGWIMTSSIITLASGIATTILNNFANGSAWFYICLGLFLVGISTILIQILISIYTINESVKNMNIEKSGLLLPQNASRAQEDLVDLVRTRTGEIGKINIICYGTSAYGDFVTDINNGVYDGAGHIDIEVVLCSTECVYMATDDNDICNVRNLLNNSSNIKIYDSKHMPTIRACIVYNRNGKAIWNCLQVYTYGGLPTAQYKNFYALVGNEDNDLLEANTSIIEKEFERLING